MNIFYIFNGMHIIWMQFTWNGVTRKHISRAIIHRIEKMTKIFLSAAVLALANLHTSLARARVWVYANSNNTSFYVSTYVMNYVRSFRPYNSLPFNSHLKAGKHILQLSTLRTQC